MTVHTFTNTLAWQRAEAAAARGAAKLKAQADVIEAARRALALLAHPENEDLVMEMVGEPHAVIEALIASLTELQRD